MKWRRLWANLLALALVVGMIPGIGAVTAMADTDDPVPTNLRVPALAYDESYIVLAWDKPSDYRTGAVNNIIDYEVFCDGESIGFARENFAENYVYLNTYMESFYAQANEEELDHYKIDIHSFKATGLDPDTDYTFKVRAIYADESVSDFSEEITQSTAVDPVIVNVLDFGAKYDLVKNVTVGGGSEETKQAMKDNTKALQAAIDACPPNGKVVIPGSGDNAEPWYYHSGSLFLHSNMTFEIAEGASIVASPNFDDFPRSFMQYSYSQTMRTYALINATTWDTGSMENVRLVGKGSVDGNGWKYSSTTDKDKAGVSSVEPLYQEKQAFDPVENNPVTDPTGNAWKLYNYYMGSGTTVVANGILAADAQTKGNADGAMDVYNSRPNLTIVRGVKNMYYGDLTFYNPPFHGIVNYQSENVITNGVVGIMFNTNNGDGIEFGDCLGITVMNSFWDTGDDSINFAAGQGATVRNLGERVASGECEIFNNFVRNGHGGLIAAGSHTGGWIGDIRCEDNLVNFSETGDNGALRLKSAAPTGGGVRNILFRDNAINYSVNTGGNGVIVIETTYGASGGTAYPPESVYPLTYENIVAQNITISNMGNKSIVAMPNMGTTSQSPRPVIKDWLLEDINVLSSGATGGNVSLNNISDITFRNINRTVTATNCKNVTIENCGPNRDVNQQPNVFEWTGGGNISVIYAGNNVGLHWQPATGSISAPTGYAILVDMLDGYGYQEKGVVTTNSASLNLAPNTEYLIAIRPQDANNVGPLATTNVTTRDAKGELTKPDLPSNKALTASSGGIGISWQTMTWQRATDAVNGIHYYKLTATPRDDSDVIVHHVYFDSAARNGYSMVGLNSSTTYDIVLTAVNWVGVESDPYNTLTCTTSPRTLLDIPQWAEDSVLTVEQAAEWVSEPIVLSWDAEDVTDFSNGDSDVFAGYRVTVDGVPVQPAEGGLDQVNAVATTKETTYTLDTSGFEADRTYKIAVEAGDQILKITVGTAQRDFTGNNKELARNRITFGKWTGHGPSVEVTLKGFEVSLDYNGGTGSVEKVFLIPGKPYGTKLPEPNLRFGYIFDGWSIDGTAEGIVQADDIVLEANNSLTAIWSVDPKVYVKLSGTALTTIADEAEYILSVANTNKLATVTLWLEVDGTYLDGRDAESLLDGFGPIGGIVWTLKEGSESTWIGRFTFGALDGEPLTSLEYTDILKMSFGLKELGDTTVKLTRVDLSGYGADNKAVFFESVIVNDTVDTEIVYNFSPYDLNRDKAVDQLDLTIAQKYFMAEEGDASWDEAKIADVDESGKVDIEDFILILNNITW